VSTPDPVRAHDNQLAPHLVRRSQTLATAKHVEGWEKLIRAFSSQGSAGFSQAHRTAPDDSKIPGYDGMTFEQRR
jgi:hypothetical protein